MHITWLGHSCFKFQDKLGGDGVVVVVDPFSSEIGLKMPHLEADIVAISHGHKGHGNLAAIKNEAFVIKGAGEYEKKGIFVEGIESWHDKNHGKDSGNNIIYRFEIDNISITHLGDLATALDDKQLEKVEGTDILLVPVGGVHALNAKLAVEVINQIEPRIIIPMHYNIPGLNIELDPLELFLKEIALQPRSEEKLKISRKDLPTEDMELVLLSC